MFNQATHKLLSLKILKWLWFVWLIYLPINLFFKFGVDSAYVGGRLVDYLIPKIYVSDLLMLIIVGGYLTILISTSSNTKKALLNLSQAQLHWLRVAGLFLILGVNQAWSLHPTVATVQFVRYLLMICFGLFSYWQRQLLKPVLLPGIVLAIIVQFSLGIFQFLRQVPLAPYAWLGESRINQVTGIAKFDWLGQERTLAYGSTAHPNILAGVVLILGLITAQLIDKKQLKIRHLTLSNNLIKTGIFAIIISTLFITQSLSLIHI